MYLRTIYLLDLRTHTLKNKCVERNENYYFQRNMALMGGVINIMVRQVNM